MNERTLRLHVSNLCGFVFVFLMTLFWQSNYSIRWANNVISFVQYFFFWFNNNFITPKTITKKVVFFPVIWSFPEAKRVCCGNIFFDREDQVRYKFLFPSRRPNELLMRMSPNIVTIDTHQVTTDDIFGFRNKNGWTRKKKRWPD